VVDWANQQHFTGWHMPDTHGNSQIFLGEFYWSPAYEYFNIPYFHHNGWTRHWNEKVPKEILLTNEAYARESGGYDCSITSEEGISIQLPVKFIADEMKLSWNGVEGCFFDKNGTLIAFDPTVRQKGNSAVLVHKDSFLNFLKENELELFWIVRGEKMSYDENIYQGKGIRPLEVSGVYYLENNSVKGQFSTHFELE
jgi:hypothetical protein